jgi:PPP family 3-phenylpropionic acid transporter
VGLVAIAQACVIPGNDLVSTGAVQRDPRLNYGRIRGAGSVAFFVTNIVGGYLIGAYGADVIVIALTLIPILGVAATLVAVPQGVPDHPQRLDVEEQPASSGLPKALWLVMIASAVIQASHGALYAFGSIHWRALGFSDAVIGYFWAFSILMEVLVFIFLGKSVGRGAGLGLIMTGAAAAAFRFSVMSFDLGMGLTFLLQALHSLSFAATHIGTMAALTAMAPARMRGRAQGIYSALAALVMAGSTIASGVIYKEAGGAVFAAMAPLGVVGFIIMLVVARTARAHPQSSGSGG